MVDMKKVEMKR